MKKKKRTQRRICLSLLSFLMAVIMAVGAPPAMIWQAEAAQSEGEDLQQPQEASLGYTVQQTAQGTFTHPGLLHTEESLQAIKQNIQKGAEPTVTAWNALKSHDYSNPSWQGRPLENVLSPGWGAQQLSVDIGHAYQNALLYSLGEGDEYGAAAARIMNGWSSTMKTVYGGPEMYLTYGFTGWEFANICELIRDREDFDKEAMKKLMLEVLYPKNKEFLRHHNGSPITSFWANWDLCNISSMLAIGVFCDRADIFEEAIEYIQNGTGSLFDMVPYVYEAHGDYGEALAQWQESGRDQGHTGLGVGMYAAICEMAWNQGYDLYGLSDNRFLKAAEYVARYNRGEDVPYSSYLRFNSSNHHWQEYTVVSDNARGHRPPIYTLIYNHYVNRKGLEAPEIKEVLYPHGQDAVLEGAYAVNGKAEGLGWQSLTFHDISSAEEGQPMLGPLEDGRYRFINRESQKALTDKDGVLQTAEKGSMEEEWWEVENTKDGEYIIKNAKTGRVVQLQETDYTSGSAAYTQGTVFGLGDAETGGMNQRLAIKRKTGDCVFTLAASASSFVMEIPAGNKADDAKLSQIRYDGSIRQEWIAEKENTGYEIAYFNFDNADEGLKGAGAVAKLQGTHAFVDDNERGKVLELTGSAYLNVEKEDASPFFGGSSEMTVSCYIKLEGSGRNWIFCTADGSEADAEIAGLFAENGKIHALRRKDGIEETAQGNLGSGWNHIVAVYAKDGLKVYVNGILEASLGAEDDFGGLLGERGILTIAKGEERHYEGLLDEFTVCNYAMDAEEIAALEDERLVAEFSFDDEIGGFASQTAAALSAGKIQLSADAKSGKALSLDASSYLKVSAPGCRSLLTGWEGLTVSFWSKMSKEQRNWLIYAAADEEVQMNQEESYLGISQQGGILYAERCHNKDINGRLLDIKAPVTEGEWQHITAVFAKEYTSIYINGKKAGEIPNVYSLQDILGENSIFYIGKANTTKMGEYAEGLMDQVRVYNFALSDAQAAKDYLGYEAARRLQDGSADDSADKAAAKVVFDKINAIGSVEYNGECYARIQEAQSAYDGLTETQKNLVSNSLILVNAKKQYEELAPIEPQCLAEFTFDDREQGFASAGGRAQIKGNVSLFNNGVSGKALKLNGSYLKLLDPEGKSLLEGCREVSVSYWAKFVQEGTNWAFYAAADDKTQQSGREAYLGIIDFGNSVKLERYKNAGERPVCPSGQAELNIWRNVTAVYGADSTKLYIDGKLVQEAKSEDKVADILGQGGVVYIGKANWGNGEYYNGLMDELKIYNYSLSQEEISALYERHAAGKTQEQKCIAKFTFDDAENGFAGNGAKAEAKGANILDNDARAGKALKLDGSGSNYLKVTDEAGESLLGGCEEVTVSYWSKVNNTGGNWAFFASPHDNSQVGGKETYLGILDSGASVKAERYRNSGARPAVAAAESSQNEWKNITVVYGKVSTKIYVDGELKSKETESSYSLPDMIGDDGVLYIGRANWGAGEYYNGLLDEYKIYNYALSEEEIKIAAEGKEELVSIIQEAGVKVGAEYTPDSWQAFQAVLEEANAVNADGNADPKQIDKAMQNLKAAMENLVRRDGMGEPDKPDNPEEPNKPDKPDNPEEPNKPDKPDKPDNPEEPNKPEDPNKSGKTLEKTKTVKAVQQQNSCYVKVSYRKVKGAVGYNIYRSTKRKTGYKKIGSSKKTSYVDKKTKNAKIYYYKVVAKAKDKSCNSALSSKYAKVKVLQRPVVNVKACKLRKIRISWKKVRGAKGYVAYTSTKKNKGFKKAKVLNKANKVKVTVTAKCGVKKLYVKVRPYYLEKGKKVYGAYSKTAAVKVKLR